MGSPALTSSIDWGNVAQWTAAIATFLAVIIALFKEEFINLWRRPKLVATIKLSPPDSTKTPVIITYPRPPEPPITKEASSYYFRLWIKNDGKARAEKVQVFAEKLCRKAADGTFLPVEGFMPMNLRWTHSGEIFTEGISPLMGKHCDLGHITHPAELIDLQEDHPDAQGKTVLALELEAKPLTKSHLVAPGTYKLTLRIAGSNCQPTTTTLEITLIGDWYEDTGRMFRDGIAIKVLD